VTVTVQAEPYESPAGQTLRGELHAELARRYGAGQSGDPVRPRVDPAVEAAGELFVARDGEGQPVGCVVLRRYAEAVFELRRMYVRPEARGHGVAAALLAALEDRARQRGAERIILECGTAQPEALAFYQGHGYRPVPRFGIYADSPRSRCFGRELAET
jgi:GNAT superfamily N-acetyltransferase